MYSVQFTIYNSKHQLCIIHNIPSSSFHWNSSTGSGKILDFPVLDLEWSWIFQHKSYEDRARSSTGISKIQYCIFQDSLRFFQILPDSLRSLQIFHDSLRILQICFRFHQILYCMFQDSLRFLQICSVS